MEEENYTSEEHDNEFTSDEEPFFITKNVLIRKWIRVIGPDGFMVLSLLSSFTIPGYKTSFPRVNQHDYGEMLGISRQRFAKSIDLLKECGLITVTRYLPSFTNKKTTRYHINSIPKNIPPNLLRNIKPFDKGNRFNDPVFNPSGKLFSSTSKSTPIVTDHNNQMVTGMNNAIIEDNDIENSKETPNGVIRASLLEEKPLDSSESKDLVTLPGSSKKVLKFMKSCSSQDAQKSCNNINKESLSDKEPGPPDKFKRGEDFHPDPAKEKKLINIPAYVEPFLQYWEDQNLVKQTRNSASFAKSITSLRQLIRGTIFNETEYKSRYMGVPINLDQWKRAVDRFVVKVNNPAYLPEDKTNIRKTPIHQFIFNAGVNFSYFVDCLEKDPAPLKRFEDKYPTLTEKIIDMYKELVLKSSNGYKPNNYEMDCFCKTSTRLVEYFQLNKPKLVSWFRPSESEISRLLVESVVMDCSNSNEYTIKPGFLSSDMTFTRRLPVYLTQQGVLDPSIGRKRSMSEIEKDLNREWRGNPGYQDHV